MSKVAKIALIVGTITLAVATSGASLGIQGALVGALGGSFAALGAAAVIAPILAGALVLGSISAATSFLKKKPPGMDGSTGGINSKVNLDPNVGQWIGAGRIALPCQLIYFGTSGATNQNLSMIFCHSGMPITGFTSLAINNIATSFPTPTGAYAGVLSIETALGTHTANPFTGVNGLWGAAHIGRGLAMSHFRWTYDADKLKAGLPQTIQFVANTSPVYDPRRDSTRGGSGTMRADDRSTWAFTVAGNDIGRNPALFELTYRLGWLQNGRLKAGMGADPTNIDYASYIASANVCDETVNGKPRYRFDALIPIGPGTVHNDNLGRIHSSCGGRALDTGGLIGFWVAQDDLATSSMTLTDDDFMGPVSWEPLAEGDIRNTGRGTYVSVADFYQTKDYPEVAPSDLRLLDNGVELADDLNFEGVLDVDQARRLTSIRIRESRQGKFMAPVAMRAFGLKPMGVVAITRARFGWTNRKFRVETMGIAIDKVQLALRAVSSTDYIDVNNTSLNAAASLQTLGYIPIAGVGPPGPAGADGAPGAPGANGATLYTWHAYADSIDGLVNFTTGAPNGRAFHGEIANQATATEGTNPAVYQWSAYKGPASFGLVATDDVVVASNRIIGKSALTYPVYSGGAYSSESYTGACAVSFSPDQTNGGFYVGLNTDPTFNNNPNTIDYAIHCYEGGTFEIYESGVSATPGAGFGAYIVGTVFTIVYNGRTVTYYAGNALLRVVNVAAGIRFWLDSSFRGASPPAPTAVTILGWLPAGPAGLDGAPGPEGPQGPAGSGVSTATVPVAFGTSSAVSVVGSGAVTARYAGPTTGSGGVAVTIAIQARPAGGTFATIASNVETGDAGDDVSGLVSGSYALGTNVYGEVRAILSTSAGDGINLRAADSYMTVEL